MKDATEFNPLHAYAHWTVHASNQWPAEARRTAIRALIDIVACMLPGAREPVVEKLHGVVKNWGTGPATLVGYSDRVSAPMAALINGTAAHALDFDDNFDPAKAHATAVLVPALLAVCDQDDLTTDDLLDAYIVGLQILGRVGQAVNPFHRSRGWHATATLGAVGAAAACARALRLSETQTAHAISLATSRAAGFMSQFGTETKPLHSGFAASGGVEAALFARAGITAGSETLHGPTGLRTLMVGPDVDTLAESMVGKAEHGQTVTFRDEDVGDPLHILHHGLKIKRFPNCGSVHRALDGLLELREMHALSADDVASIHVRAPAAHLRNLMYEMPETPAEAKFSLEYNLAVGLMRGDVGLENFEPQQISRADIRSLYPIITKDYVEALESDFPTEVHIQTKDGRRFETRRAMPVGSREHPLTDAQILAKFENCARATTGFENGEALAKTFRSLESNMPVRQISSLMT